MDSDEKINIYKTATQNAKSVHSCLKLGLSVLVSGFAEEREHIFLVCFNAGLVERIYSEQIAGNGASFLEEVYEIAEIICASGIKLEYDIRNAAVVVRKESSEHCGAVYIVQIHTCKEVQTVDVCGIVRDFDAVGCVLDIENSLKLIAQTVLDVLTEGVQIGREDNGCREDALLILTLALAVELLPPLADHLSRRLVCREDLGDLTLSVKDISDSGVSYTLVCDGVIVQILGSGVSSAAHHCVDVDACNSDRKQSDCGKNGVTSADIVGNDECFVTHFVGELLEGSAALISCNENTGYGSLDAVLLLEKLTEDTERNSRLGSRTGLGDNVDADVLAFTDLQKICKSGGTDAVSGKVYGGGTYP